MKTPFLISLKYPCFEDYLMALSTPSRWEIRNALKKNADLIFEPIPYNRYLLSEFMSLWEKQTVYGKSVAWPFGIGFVEYLAAENKLLVFRAKCILTGEVLCLMFAEVHGKLIEAHPPMYDKDIYLSRELAKFMFANFFKYLIDARVYDWVDLYSGYGRSWKDTVQDYQNGKNKSYKWIYVPDKIKKGYTNEKAFRVFINLLFFSKKIRIEENYKFTYLELLKLKLIRFFFWWKGERISRITKKIRKIIKKEK